MAPRDASKNKRVELGDRSREKILDAATTLMSARGYDGTSISAIANESGLPASSLYWHFTSKLGILEAVVERGSTRFREAMAHDMPTRRGSRVDQVAAILEAAARAVETSPEFVRLQLVVMLNSPAGVIDAAVAATRAQQRVGLREELATAFADLGADQADAAAGEVVEFAEAAFEGILVADLIGSTSTKALIRQLAQATVALAEAFVASHPG